MVLHLRVLHILKDQQVACHRTKRAVPLAGIVGELVAACRKRANGPRLQDAILIIVVIAGGVAWQMGSFTTRFLEKEEK
jgi:hypothetical protein